MDALTLLLHAYGLDAWLPVILQIIGVAALVAALLPHPAPGSPLAPLRTLLDGMAANIGNAKNAVPAAAVPKAVPVILLLALGAALSACSNPTQQAKAVAALKTACVVDGAVQPVAVSLVPMAGPAGAAVATIDATLVHPTIVAACAALGGFPAPDTAVVPAVAPVTVAVPVPATP